MAIVETEEIERKEEAEETGIKTEIGSRLEVENGMMEEIILTKTIAR